MAWTKLSVDLNSRSQDAARNFVGFHLVLRSRSELQNQIPFLSDESSAFSVSQRCSQPWRLLGFAEAARHREGTECAEVEALI